MDAEIIGLDFSVPESIIELRGWVAQMVRAWDS